MFKIYVESSYFELLCLSSLFLSLSEEKAKLLRDIVSKIEDKNQILE